MPKQKESRFASKLRELGFEQLPEEMCTYMDHRTERRLRQRFGDTITRNERRIIAKEMRRPRFLIFSGENPSTHATDEMGQHWVVRGKMVNLECHGFRNDAPLMPIVAAMPPLPPEQTN